MLKPMFCHAQKSSFAIDACATMIRKSCSDAGAPVLCLMDMLLEKGWAPVRERRT